MRTFSQLRSDYALNKVLDYYRNGNSKKEFKSLSSSSPSMILQNGFGQTLAFLLARRNNSQHSAVFEIIREWLVQQGLAQGKEPAEFLESLTGENSTQKKYLSAQNESLALLEWVKRYATAFYQEV